MGSKAKHATEILSAITKEVGGLTGSAQYENWVEPFVGGANMIDKVYGMNRFGNDINEYLISLFQAVQDGFMPPDEITEAQYHDIKNNPEKYSKALVAFTAIGCSYSGKWWGGYARGNANNGSPRNYCLESKKNLLSQDLKGIVFTSGEYHQMVIPEKSIVYCDPPYAETTKYKNRFDHDAFWKWCEDLSKTGVKVFVSEYKAPEGWRCVWQKEVHNSLTKDTGSKKGVERLFTI